MRKTFFFPLIALTIIEGFLVVLATITIPADTKNAFLLGFSKSRLILLLFQLFGILSFSILLLFRQRFQNWIECRFITNKANNLITSIGILSYFFLWIVIFTPTKNLYLLEASFIRSKPALIWLGLILMQFVLWIKISKNTFNLSINNAFRNIKSLLIAFLPLSISWIIITISKLGLVNDTPYWNVPGIPLSLLQFIGITVFLLQAIIYSSCRTSNIKSTSLFVKLFIPLLIYIATVLLWGFTPMLKHYFSLEPTLPNMQPYPYSDARVHDLGALSIVMGKGIYFNRFTDKPLYMLFLAILHVFTGNDYHLLQWALISVLALIPVFLYTFGKEYFGNLFGIVLAVWIMFQQRNAIALSFSIASVNPKLLATEELLLLGIVLVTLLFYRWMRAPDFITIFILGGLIGTLSLVRLNPIFIAPVIVIFIIIRLRKIPKLLIKQVFLFSIGFIMIFSPWLFTGVDSEGRSWFFLKIQDVIQRRYPSQSEVIYPDALLAVHDFSNQNNSSVIQVNTIIKKKISATVITPLVKNDQKDHLSWTMFNHFLHNYTTSLLALPDSITIDSLSDLSKREYWQDKNQWNGDIPAGQYLLVLVNIFVITIGISVSWRKYRLAGMVPLIVFFAYNLSLGVALNSGSRYIVPINWIVFFYFALGLVIISQIILSFLGIKTVSLAIENEQPSQAGTNRPLKAWVAPIAILVVVSLMLPFANFVVPKLVRSEIKTDQLLVLARTIEPEDHQLVNGVLLYPYYNSDGTISFVFVDDSNFTTFNITDDHLISTITIIPESGMPALISIKDDNGEVTLKSIYVEYEDLPYLFWQNGEP